jgi:hypothetical protein
MSKHVSLSGRVEYFDDPSGVQIKSIVPGNPFSSFSTGLCLNVNVKNNALFRMEGRHFFSSQKVYVSRYENPVKNMSWLVSSMTVWF